MEGQQADEQLLHAGTDNPDSCVNCADLCDLIQTTSVEYLFGADCSLCRLFPGHGYFDMHRLYEDLPRDLDEAACIDGCGTWGIFFRIIVPLMKPAVATVSIYTFLQCWNELMFANIFVSDSVHKTLPVGVQALSGQYMTDWGPIGAALVLATFPTLIFYAFFSKKIQESFIAGAVKG